MSETRCCLPRWQKEGASYFVTWRLHGSLPSKVTADLLTTEGAKFLKQDRLLDAAATGPRWLIQPAVAASVARILLDSEVEGKCELGPWVLMPNHVHVLLRPRLDLPKVVSWIKAVARETPIASSAAPVAHSGRGTISIDGFAAESTKRKLHRISNKTRSEPAFARLPRGGGGPAPGRREIERGCHRASRRTPALTPYCPRKSRRSPC